MSKLVRALKQSPPIAKRVTPVALIAALAIGAFIAIGTVFGQGAGTAYAADDVGISSLDQDTGITSLLDDTGGVTTDATFESAITDVTFQDGGPSAADLQSKGVIGNGTDPGADVAPATVDVNDNNGIISAIPIVGDGVNTTSEIYLLTIVGAILLSATAIAGFDYMRSRTRRQRRRDIPIAATINGNGGVIGVGYSLWQRIKTSGRVAQAPFVAGGLRSRATPTSTRRQAKATRTSIPA